MNAQLGSLSKDNFEQRTLTGSETVSFKPVRVSLMFSRPGSVKPLAPNFQINTVAGAIPALTLPNLHC